MDWFLYDSDLRHEIVKSAKLLSGNVILPFLVVTHPAHNTVYKPV